MEAEDLLDRFAQDEGFGNWDTVVLNCHHSVIRSVAIAAVNQALRQPPVSASLPSESDLQAIVERIAYERFGEEQAEDCYAKMGLLYEFVKSYVVRQ